MTTSSPGCGLLISGKTWIPQIAVAYHGSEASLPCLSNPGPRYPATKSAEGYWFHPAFWEVTRQEN
ncbi:hypothetical protein VTK73DRAFT_4882 [Phialemonium thermophilum]|uniref:Uncharacterized protein n=1 Tax=Phialemonium thermophilum TaxID=223376 RepID=A0ABR3V579_9PEZI